MAKWKDITVYISQFDIPWKTVKTNMTNILK